jgi:hypothetical protein
MTMMPSAPPATIGAAAGRPRPRRARCGGGGRAAHGGIPT